MNMELLQQKINESGMPISTIAERAEISRPTLYYRLEHPETWRVNEMVNISKTLHLTRALQMAIFDI